jgi:hypothetical protein
MGRTDLIQVSQVPIEQHLVSPDEENAAFDERGGQFRGRIGHFGLETVYSGVEANTSRINNENIHSHLLKVTAQLRRPGQENSIISMPPTLSVPKLFRKTGKSREGD